MTDRPGDDSWQAWVGRRETRREQIAPFPAQALAALFDDPGADRFVAGASITGVWSWLYFLAATPSAQIGPDGHPKRGGFLPPITLERRMWAGSRCVLHADLVIGQTAEKESEIIAVREKSGRTGSMVFVTVRHRVRSDDVVCFEEEQDIVYMPIPERFTPPDPVALPSCAYRRELEIDPVLLFRFSALTYNGHRIHYDRTYAHDVERYPGLVVHGPLQALALFEAARGWFPQKTITGFAFRGVRPLFDFDRASLNATPREEGGLDLFAAQRSSAQGEDCITMQASVQWR